MANKCLQGVVAIEFFDGADNQAKSLLEQTEIIKLNQQISKELLIILPSLDQASYSILGALYQSNELLQPGFPTHTQLRQYVNASLKGENNKRNQLIIGANQDQLPQGFNSPLQNITSPMLYMPFVILTEDQQTQEYFEQELMHKGMGSIELLKELQSSFNAKIRHVNFMTLLDLAAMMHNHMQMAGFEPLWTLLEQALFNSQPECKIKTEQGNEFYLSKKIVFSPYFSKQYWLKVLKREEQDYYQWIVVQRQYQSALEEHGLDVRLFLPVTWPIDDKHICFASLDKLAISNGFFKEIIRPIPENSETEIEPQNHPQLGLICFKVIDQQDGEELYYPISSEGIQNINQQLLEQP
jgi:hypothetical protein